MVYIGAETEKGFGEINGDARNFSVGSFVNPCDLVIVRGFFYQFLNLGEYGGIGHVHVADFGVAGELERGFLFLHRPGDNGDIVQNVIGQIEIIHIFFLCV